MLKRKIHQIDGDHGDADSQDDIHPARKTKIDYTESETRLAKAYNDLSDEVTKVRLAAAATLIRAVKDMDSAQLEKVLGRLTKGLCSGRKAARSGFFVALTEFLSLLAARKDPNFTFISIVTNISSLTQPNDNKPSRRVSVRSMYHLFMLTNLQEQKDYALGRCIAYKAVLQSSLIETAHVAGFGELIEHIVSLIRQSPLMQRECGASLHESLRVMAVSQNQHSDRVSLMLQKLHDAKLLKTPEGLAIWMTASRLFPKATFPTGVWHKQDPLCPKEQSALVGILRGSGEEHAREDPDNAKAQRGAPQAMPSFAWPVVLTAVIERDSIKVDKPIFPRFWIEAVDDAYFSATASTEKKAVGLQIFSLAINLVPSTMIQETFTPNLVRCIVNQRSNLQSNLHQSARSPLDLLISKAKKEPHVGQVAALALLADGRYNFDPLTKTKTVEALLLASPTQERGTVLPYLRKSIQAPQTTEHLDESESRRHLADLVTFLTKQDNTTADVDAPKSAHKATGKSQTQAMALLADFAFLQQSTDTAQSMQPATRKLFQNRLDSCLSQMLKSRSDPQYNAVFDLVTQIYASSETESSGFVFAPPDEVAKLFKVMNTRLHEFQRIQKKSEAKSKSSENAKRKSASATALKLLYCLTLLRSYGGDTEAIAMLEDLEMCYESWRESDNPTVILVELLLSFLSKPSTLYRSSAEQVFAAFTSELGEEGFQSLLDILSKPENISGQQDLFEHEDEEGGSDSGEEEDSSIEGGDASDVEIASNTSETADERDDDSATSATSDDDSDDKSADEEVLAFENKLAQALGSSRPNGMDADDASSDDSDMDDDAMEKLDGHLSTIFTERKKQSTKKQDSKEAKASIINFKNRVLDLLHIYVKQEPDNVLALGLILPLLTLSRKTTSKQTAEKALGVLRQLSDSCNNTKRFPGVVDTAEEGSTSYNALDILQDVHTEMKLSNSSNLHKTATSRASLFLTKVLVHADLAHFDTVADMYAALHKEWYHDLQSQIQPAVFTEWTSWCIATRKSRATARSSKKKA